MKRVQLWVSSTSDVATSEEVSLQILNKTQIKYWLPPVLALLAISILLYPSAGQDDSYITYWSSYALSKFGTIVNYNGERVEQSSSLLHVLLLATLYKATGLSFANLGAFVSISAGVGAIIVTQRLASRYVGWVLSVAASLLVATSAYFAFWTTGALETTLAALLTTALILGFIKYLDEPDVRRIPISLWVLTPMYLLVRPESITVIACALAGTLVFLQIRHVLPSTQQNREYQRSTLRVLYLMAMVGVITIVILALRYLYFGDFFPQPVSAKTLGFSIDKLILGANFLLVWATDPPLICYTLLTMAGGLFVLYRIYRGLRPPAGATLMGMLLLAQLAFVVSTGGDYMEGARFLVPVIPIAAVLTILTIPNMLKREYTLPLIGAVLLVQSWGLISFAQASSTSIPLWATINYQQDFSMDGFSWFEKTNRHHIRDIPTVSGLNEAVQTVRNGTSETDPVWILSGQMGMVPFYVTQEHFGNVRYVDRWALATDDFTRCPATSGIPARYDGRWAVSYEFFFEHQQLITSECSIPKPDIVYEVTDPRWPEAQLASLLESNGYTIVYKQFGAISTNSRLRGSPVSGDQIIAVKNELAHLFGKSLPKVVEFSG